MKYTIETMDNELCNLESNDEKESKKYVRYLLETQKHPKGLQATASFFWIYEEAFVWDVFIKVLEKKRDKLTLPHIKIAIRQCYSSSQNNQIKKYMSEQQREELIAILKEKNILQKEISLLENM